MNGPGLVHKILKNYLTDIPKQIQIMKGYLETGENSGTELQAHSIKGAAANVDEERLVAVAFKMEKSAAAGDLAGAGACFDELNAAFDRFKDAVRDMDI